MQAIGAFLDSYKQTIEEHNMATFKGKILSIDAKQSKKGNTYHRLQIQAENGNTDWWTTFTAIQPNSDGATCQFATKTWGEGEIIDEYHIVEPGMAQSPAQGAQGAPSAGASSSAGGHRDMWIFAECYYQHAINNIAIPPDGAESKEILAEALSAAILANEVFKAYDSEGPSAARNLIRSALPDTPEAKVAQMQDDAMAGSTDVSNPEHPAFDQDVPF
jgi:hypothetical protein